MKRPPDQAFLDRLAKRYRHWSRWARRVPTTAFRIYDRDIPEYPITLDWLSGHILLVEYPRRGATPRTSESSFLDATAVCLDVPPERIHVRLHQPKRWGREQYEKLSADGQEVLVEESGLKFWVNLTRYLDPGLFLDHRPTRAMIREEAARKRVLNLFSYTGSFSVYAASGGAASTTSVDLSSTYLDWSKRNFAINGFDLRGHEFIRADAREWAVKAANAKESFDLVILDPPSFSCSKAMRGTFDVQRDYLRMIDSAATLLQRSGTLYFSTNYQRFELDEAGLGKLGLLAENITSRTIPPDFRNPKIHQCWRIRASVSFKNSRR